MFDGGLEIQFFTSHLSLLQRKLLIPHKFFMPGDQNCHGNNIYAFQGKKEDSKEFISF